MEEVLEIFRRRKLYAKSSKYEFGRQKLVFLGHRLSVAGESMDLRKVLSIREWATPTSCSEARRFTGLAKYYRRFVEGYAEVAAPLTALGSPTARFVWDPEAQASFEALKQALSSAPVLRTFDPCRRAVLTTDASGLAVAAILTQPDDEGHQHPVAYESRKLTTAERNYPAHILELLAVVHALRIFRHYLLGSGAPRAEGCWSDFDLRTDNQAITWLKTNRHLNKMYVPKFVGSTRSRTSDSTSRTCRGPGIRRIRCRVAASQTVMALPPRRVTRSPRVNRSSTRATAGIRHHLRFLQLCWPAGARHAEYLQPRSQAPRGGA